MRRILATPLLLVVLACSRAPAAAVQPPLASEANDNEAAHGFGRCPRSLNASELPPGISLEGEVSCTLRLLQTSFALDLSLVPGGAPYVAAEGEGSVQLPTGSSPHAIASVTAGSWNVQGFVAAQQLILTPTAPLLLSGVVIPVEHVKLTHGEPGRLSIEYELDAESFSLRETVLVKGSASCEQLVARTAGQSLPAFNTEAFLGEALGERFIAADSSIAVSAGPEAPAELVWQPTSPGTVSLLEEKLGWSRFASRHEHRAYIVGWTPSENLKELPPHSKAKMRVPRVRMGATLAPERWTFNGVMTCPHQLALVAAQGEVRRAVGYLAEGGVAFRRSTERSSTETLLETGGIRGIHLYDKGSLLLQHKSVDQCFCDPSWNAHK